jgi:perosamine synthetase
VIPVNTPLLDGNERRYLLECIESGWISSEGPFVAQFEAAMAAQAGRREGVAVCNGTAALDVAVDALEIGPGDEVILPTFTIISCVLQVIRAGATPVLVDSDPAAWTMDVGQVEARITERTKAIMAVHIYGLPVDMDPLLAVAERRGLALIEDAAEAHGLRYKGRPCGSFGALSTFSFYPNKHVTTGEGGMVVTDDPALAETCRSLRNLCFQPGARFVHERLGWNYRMTNMQAALGVAQIERLEQTLARKRQIGALYQELLADLDGVQRPVSATAYAENGYWVYGLVLSDDAGFTADEAMHRLGAHGIGARPYFHPLHMQPVLRGRGLFADERHPVAERLRAQGFYIPSGVGLTDGEIGRVAEAVKGLFR